MLRQFLEEGEGWIENNIEACRTLSLCHARLGQNRKAKMALLRSLEYDIPRAEVCCDLGAPFLGEERYDQAIFWYEQALSRKREDTSGAFILPDCYGFLPCIQLCVCYDRLGQKEKARQYNERAGQYKPDSAVYQFNRAYYEKFFSEQMAK